MCFLTSLLGSSGFCTSAQMMIVTMVRGQCVLSGHIDNIWQLVYTGVVWFGIVAPKTIPKCAICFSLLSWQETCVFSILKIKTSTVLPNAAYLSPSWTSCVAHTFHFTVLVLILHAYVQEYWWRARPVLPSFVLHSIFTASGCDSSSVKLSSFT